jgi:hypothetical protein
LIRAFKHNVTAPVPTPASNTVSFARAETAAASKTASPVAR